MRGELRIHPDVRALAEDAARSFAEGALGAARRGQPFHAALTGGGSPRETYRLLGRDPLAGRVPWEAVHLYWGDERCVPPGHPRSNFGMANDAFVGRVPIPPAQVHRIRGELGAERAAREYEAELRDLFAGDAPRFDLIHLGVGGDGHIASLFPFDLPRLRERDRWVAASLRLPLGEPRVTLTYAALNAAKRVEVLLPDAGKAAVARKAIRGPLDPFRLPVQGVRPVDGTLVWRLSEDSARNLRAR